ncbi:KU80 protein [Novymonas esmeraldas]|uniref:KU80 protein n=1 Tax=Novymonas esmeraldas TaxID=1808958 RepID=A0AAW0F2P6_9TRYP
MSKSAAVLVLDTALRGAAAQAEACDVCARVITDKMIYAPSDEVAVVLTSTAKSRSTLYDVSEQARYHHITVAAELGPATRQTLAPITATRASAATAAEEAPGYDLIDALHVAVALLQARTSGKKYSRFIYLVTDARHEVKHKHDLLPLVDALQADAVTLVVIGVDFAPTAADVEAEQPPEASSTVDAATAWAGLSIKVQNEAVLRELCAALGGSSAIVSPAEALAGLSLLRRRKIRQQPLLKVVLRIGDVRLATQLFTLAQEERLPTLRRSTRDGADVVPTVEYVVCSDADGPPRVLAKEERVRALFLGADRVSCNEADLEAMKVRGPRALEAVGFVEESLIAPYMLMGGTRVLLPLAGDGSGQRGFHALVEAMRSCGKAMLVRFVRTADAAPVLSVCFPRVTDSAEEVERYLVVAPLPFAQDLRVLRFPEYRELRFTTAEEQLMDELIDGLTVEETELAPQDTFNPVLQQYYATLAATLAAAANAPASACLSASHKMGAHHDGPLCDGGAAPAAVVPPLLPQLRGTSTAFGADGSAVRARVEACRASLAACARAFPYEEDVEAPLTGGAGGGVQKRPWYHNLATASSLPGTRDDTAAGGLGDAAGTSDGSRAASEVTNVSADPHSVVHSSAAPAAITTVDPVGTFTAIVRGAGAAGHQQLDKARDDLSDVIWLLLRHSVKDSLYRKCVDCIVALRRCCVTMDDAAYFNAFLVKLEVVARECGRTADFWEPCVVQRQSGAQVWPITAAECRSSTLPDAAAAEAFLMRDRFATTIAVDDDADEDDWLAEIQ